MKKNGIKKDKQFLTLFNFIVTEDVCKMVAARGQGEFYIPAGLNFQNYYKDAMKSMNELVFPDYVIRNFKIESEYPHITRYIYESITNYTVQNSAKIILSNRTIGSLANSLESDFLKKISGKYITEFDWEKQKSKT